MTEIAGTLIDTVRERGRLTVAAFMDLALYEPGLGYYARRGRRSGRAGDFFTSVDVGPLFGELLAVQFAEMARLLDPEATRSLDLVEAGAGDGRLSADLLRALGDRDPQLYERTRLHLIETSPAARDAQHDALGRARGRLVYSDSRLPDAYEGLLFANELLDALPVHQVVMRSDGLREVFVQAEGDRLITVEDTPSTPALADYLKAVDISLECGWRVEIGLQAVEWIREAARRLQRGFLVLVDYGHQARELYAPGHEGGTLTTFFRHASTDADPNDCTPEWLRSPGDQDITAHVDFTSARAAAEAEGLVTLALLDQTYFLMGLANLDAGEAAVSLTDVRRRRAFQTLIMPGGLGSTMKVLISARNVGTPALRGCSYKVRAT